MIFELAAVVVPVWVGSLAVLLTPKSFYGNTWDKLTKGKYRPDRASLLVMLDNLRTNPEDWSINRGDASYPAKGAKKIYISTDSKGVMTYSMPAFGSESRPMMGHFAKEFKQALTKEASDREVKALVRDMYPNVNEGTLRLT